MVLPGLLRWRQVAVVWYPSERLINHLFGWNPSPPADQDRT